MRSVFCGASPAPPDTAALVRERLADGRHIADMDVRALLDALETVRDERNQLECKGLSLSEQNGNLLMEAHRREAEAAALRRALKDVSKALRWLSDCARVVDHLPHCELKEQRHPYGYICTCGYDALETSTESSLIAASSALATGAGKALAEEHERWRAVVEAARALREDALGISEGYKDAKGMHTWRAGVAHKEVWDRFIDAVDALAAEQK